MSSSLPLYNNNNINIEGSEQYIDPLDDWLSVYQDVIVNEGQLSNYDKLIISNVDDHEKGFEKTKINVGSPNNHSIRAKNKRLVINEEINGEGAKKQLDHNAKERIRRMKINASFLALRALLPNSTRSKKRLGAPALVDRVIKYIPEMENEVQALTSKKQSLQSSKKDENIPTFLFNRLNEREAVIQMCIGRQEYEDGLALMKLMQKVEDYDEGISINSVSALHISDNAIVCCHLHIQVTDATFGVEFIEQLKDKIIYWLK